MAQATTPRVKFQQGTDAKGRKYWELKIGPLLVFHRRGFTYVMTGDLPTGLYWE